MNQKKTLRITDNFLPLYIPRTQTADNLLQAFFLNHQNGSQSSNVQADSRVQVKPSTVQTIKAPGSPLFLPATDLYLKKVQFKFAAGSTNEASHSCPSNIHRKKPGEQEQKSRFWERSGAPRRFDLSTLWHRTHWHMHTLRNTCCWGCE